MGEPLVGVAAVFTGQPPRRSIFTPGQFLLTDKVAMITGAQRNIGLDMALVLAEAGATVYCIDLPSSPIDFWLKAQKYVEALPDIPGLLEGTTMKGKGRLEYISGDVTDQQKMWDIAEEIVRREGICFANAGVMGGVYCLDYLAKDVREVHRPANLHF
ncbi:hypothetical protein D9756_006395 [Leucocoprinus leucothites]|uniref:Uncharacterized protein n=1 Tax=Leucocoprinus leucothites TaxID=201217 RepID=A0A8H5G222_9AGAR|nr:hypothetical protein D9756_006395 [Leucoagaricus leucothites]